MTAVQTGTIQTSIPARLDRLPWARFHWLIVVGLGTAWILDGLEVTIVGTVAARMTSPHSGIAISAAQIGTAGSVYVAGACLGALFFGQLTDRFGRKKLFMITLGIYLVGTALTALSFDPLFFFIFRFITGAGIGGEYSAINSAIDELIPKRARGTVDLVINGTYWAGSAAGSAAAIFFLDKAIFPADIGWRLAFVLGIILAIFVMIVRRNVPESPRWMFIHGFDQDAERLVDEIEHGIVEETGQQLEPVERTLTVRQRRNIPFREIAKVAFGRYPRRALLCFALFVGQAFIYNGVTFNLGGLMHSRFGVATGFVPIFIIVYALSNLAGPLILGRYFDTIGRKPMISSTYIGSALIALVLAGLFTQTDLLSAWPFIIIVMGSFFLASAGASAAYLTTSEIFPLETRALAIAFFYAIGTAVGGITGPILFSRLFASDDKDLIALAFVIGAAVMLWGGITEIFIGVKAEQQSLEDIAKPLTTAEDGSTGGQQGGGQQGSGEDDASVARGKAAAERARAAEHRANAHELLANAPKDDPDANERAGVENQLAERSDLMAQAEDERVAAAELRADTPEGGHGARATGYRAEAAEARAHGHERGAAALTAGDEAEAERIRASQEAAKEHARGLEQLASAEDAREQHENADADEAEGNAADAAEAGAQAHEAYSRMHEQLATALECEADGDDDGANLARERARMEREQAEADQARADAAGWREQEARVSPDQAAERDEVEERIRRRLERARQRSMGLHRFRPGPGGFGGSAAGGSGGSPSIGSPAPPPEVALDPQIEALRRALDEHGETQRDQLATLVGARYWGPGVYRKALRIAVQDGDVRRIGRDTYATGGEPDR